MIALAPIRIQTRNEPSKLAHRRSAGKYDDAIERRSPSSERATATVIAPASNGEKKSVMPMIA